MCALATLTALKLSLGTFNFNPSGPEPEPQHATERSLRTMQLWEFPMLSGGVSEASTSNIARSTVVIRQDDAGTEAPADNCLVSTDCAGVTKAHAY